MRPNPKGTGEQIACDADVREDCRDRQSFDGGNRPFRAISGGLCLKTLIYQRLVECVFRGNVAAQEILAGRVSAGDDRQKLHEKHD